MREETRKVVEYMVDRGVHEVYEDGGCYALSPQEIAERLNATLSTPAHPQLAGDADRRDLVRVAMLAMASDQLADGERLFNINRAAAQQVVSAIVATLASDPAPRSEEEPTT